MPLHSEIADELCISGVTVKSHLGRIFGKPDLRDRAAAIVTPTTTGSSPCVDRLGPDEDDRLARAPVRAPPAFECFPALVERKRLSDFHPQPAAIDERREFV